MSRVSIMSSMVKCTECRLIPTHYNSYDCFISFHLPNQQLSEGLVVQHEPGILVFGGLDQPMILGATLLPPTAPTEDHGSNTMNFNRHLTVWSCEVQLNISSDIIIIVFCNKARRVVCRILAGVLVQSGSCCVFPF